MSGNQNKVLIFINNIEWKIKRTFPRIKIWQKMKNEKRNLKYIQCIDYAFELRLVKITTKISKHKQKPNRIRFKICFFSLKA